MTDNATRFSRSTAELASLATLSPLVMGARMAQFWIYAASPRPRDRREAERMVTEKMQAMGESVFAMNMATMNAFSAVTIAAMTGTARNVDDADAILHAGLRPYSDRVRANRRRLMR